MLGKRLPQRLDYMAGFIQAQSRLRQVGHAVRIGHVQIIHVLGCIHHLGHQRSFAQRADDLVMIAVADQDQRIAFAGELHRLDVDLGHQRAGRVNHPQLAQLAGLPHLGRDAVGAVNHPLAGRNFVHAVDKNGALGGQLVHHVAVMDDLLAHVDRRAEGFQGNADNVDGPHHSGAKASRLQQ